MVWNHLYFSIRLIYLMRGMKEFKAAHPKLMSEILPATDGIYCISITF